MSTRSIAAARRGLIAGLLLLPMWVWAAPEVATDGGPAWGLKEAAIGIISVALVALLVGGMLFYMQSLQRRFYDGCRESQQLALFFQSPAGLPTGTIRSILALIIITLSLYFIALQFVGLTDNKFPEALTTLLGAVVGFYFASRSNKGEERVLQDQVKEMKQARDDEVSARKTEQAQGVMGQVRKGLDLAKAATALLPEERRKAYEQFTGKLEGGLDTVEKLISGADAGQALDEAKKVFNDFAKGNPVYDAVSRAGSAFAGVLGSSVPQFALIASIVTVGVRLGGAKYQKWKNRILHAPIAPDVVPLKPVDSTSLFLMFVNVPPLKQAFAAELEAQNRATISAAGQALLTGADLEALWSQYGDRFEDQATLEEAVAGLRRLAADAELRQEVDPAWIEVAGGFDALIANIDRLHQYPGAQARLDELVLMVEGLQQEGQPVLKILQKVRKELGDG